MKICVYGAGAVGGHLAARFAAGGADVSVVARGAHASAIRERGLVLLRGDDRLTVHPKCADDPGELGVQDVVVISVKGPGLPDVASRLAVLLDSDTRVVFAMNGIPWWFSDGKTIAVPDDLMDVLDPQARLRRTLSPEQIVGCAIYSGNAIAGPGVIRSTTPQRNRMIFGKPDGARDTRMEAFAEFAGSTGIEAVTTSNIRQAIWVKMQLIVSASPVCTLTRQTLGGALADRDLLELTAAMMRETAALGRALGFRIEDDVDTRLATYRESALKPSMLQDLEAGKMLEVDNGIQAFRALAAEIAFPVPMLDVVGSLVAGLARATCP